VLTVPSVADLATFTGADPASYTSYANAALAQSTLLFMIRSEIYEQSEVDAMPAYNQQLEKNGILSMADSIYLQQPYRSVKATPFQTETIGSYTYSKPIEYGRGSAASLALKGEQTGIMWFDLAIQMLAKRDVAGGVYAGQLQCFELSDSSVQVMVNAQTGQLWLQGPADRDWQDGPFPFDINSDTSASST
jgi:hypothetical protein